MRLSSSEIKIIKSVACEVLGNQAHIYLFGSRADDFKKGGDIDLYVNLPVDEAPREIIQAIPGLELVEFPENREIGVCCGAGGGVKTGHPDLSQKIAGEKIDSLSRIGADILASTCPFCKRNLDDARVTAGSAIEVLDVIELADRMMEPENHA